MSRNTITLADYRGIKVRTVVGKRYYVVIPNGPDKAKVIKRTDSAVAVTHELARWIDTVAYEVKMRDGQLTGIECSDEYIVGLAAMEKRAAKSRKVEVARFGRGY